MNNISKINKNCCKYAKNLRKTRNPRKSSIHVVNCSRYTTTHRGTFKSLATASVIRLKIGLEQSTLMSN